MSVSGGSQPDVTEMKKSERLSRFVNALETLQSVVSDLLGSVVIEEREKKEGVRWRICRQTLSCHVDDAINKIRPTKHLLLRLRVSNRSQYTPTVHSFIAYPTPKTTGEQGTIQRARYTNVSNTSRTAPLGHSRGSLPSSAVLTSGV